MGSRALFRMARKMPASMEKLRKKAQYQLAVRFIGVFGSVNEEIVNRLLVSVASNMVTRFNPVILPFGPKIFFALSLIVAEMYNEIGIWYVTGDMTSNYQKFEASDHIIAFQIELGNVENSPLTSD